MKLTVQNRSTRGKTCPSATLSTTNPTWTGWASNPGLELYIFEATHIPCSRLVQLVLFPATAQR
jgi:hypothetical protein